MEHNVMSAKDYCDLMRLVLRREATIFDNMQQLDQVTLDRVNELNGIDQLIRNIQRKTHGQCTIMKAQRGQLPQNPS